MTKGPADGRALPCGVGQLLSGTTPETVSIVS